MKKINMEKMNNVTGGIGIGIGVGSIPITYTTKYPFAEGRKEVADISPKKKVWIF